MTDNTHQLDNINSQTGEQSKKRPNKTQLKRDMKVLYDLGRELVELTPRQLTELSLSERLIDAINMAKRLKKTALQRQLRYIAKAMQEEDIETIQNQLEQLALSHQQNTDAFHEIEEWRDKLVAGDDELMNQIVEKFINADRQYLRQLVRNANKEAQQNKPPKSSRLLYKYLRNL